MYGFVAGGALGFIFGGIICVNLYRANKIVNQRLAIAKKKSVIYHGPIDAESKMYCLNENGVPEWIVAHSKLEALLFVAQCWGMECILEEFNEFAAYFKGVTPDDFIEYFVKELPLNEPLAMIQDNGEQETKPVADWLKEIKKSPSYFACQEY